MTIALAMSVFTIYRLQRSRRTGLCTLPDATQVADRWHLMENASAAFLDAVRLSMRAIRRALVHSTDPGRDGPRAQAATR